MADCDVCAQPQPDAAYACAKCAIKARRWLDTIAEVAGSARDIAHGERLRGAPAAVGTSSDDRLPINPTARQRFEHASGTVITWARHVSETRGMPVTDRPPAAGPLCAAAARRLDCWHRSCTAIRETTDPLAVAAWWLLGHVEWLRHRQEAAEAFADIAAAGRDLQRLADRPPDLVVVGACECGHVLYAPQRASVARCRECGQSWDVERSRDILREHLDGMLLTAAEIATMAVIGDPDANRSRVRKLINQWASRGRITARGHSPDGDQLYRFGEVNTLLTPTEKAAS